MKLPSIINVLKSITSHPLNRDRKVGSIVNFFKWQLVSKLMPYPMIIPFAGDNKLIIKKGLSSATGNLYSGLLEFEEMSFALHFLREEDLFIDVGANIGMFSVLASGAARTKTIAFEPAITTFSHLQDNIAINRIGHLVETINKGVGSKEGAIKFTQGLDAINHVATSRDTQTVEVEIVTLDSVLRTHNPVLMKVDVEGFECEVINGAMETIAKPSLQAIIIELRGHGNRYGFDENDVHERLLRTGFRPYRYEPFTRKLVLLDGFGGYNTIYVKDLTFVESRLKSAKKIKIGNKSF
jgi:FkbM family methyltransferase